MKIALIGATGYVGASLLSEALARGHRVTAVVRHAGDRLRPHANLTVVEGDATDAAALARVVHGHELVISAFNPGLDADGIGARAIVEGVKRGGVGRLLVVGGAGSLHLPSGERVVDQPDFPAEWKEGALRTAAFLDWLRGEQALDWVFLSPAAMLAPGERTGRYRVGKDELLTDSNGESRISLEDYAVAMLDEAQRPRHHQARFTVAY
ncbi:NAD(P)-dependent oxidoreductase [Bordetella flabilis]|uniref:3-beta hydroxysteroid dehydrogenase n=1 Tax=Bordetella flabilis TaxID=463014 RepID=A0A193GCB9_9BORD|nr:NAD(P)-dependent oxidoreductase [Bordetella flabilis]ANN77263.1 3-beta hydroxysteroid dehydrogenase [Bordetella flabilis]